MKNKLLESITEIEKNGLEFTNIYVGDQLVWSLMGTSSHFEAVSYARSLITGLNNMLSFDEIDVSICHPFSEKYKIMKQKYTFRESQISNLNLLIKAKSTITVINYGEGFKKIAN